MDVHDRDDFGTLLRHHRLAVGLTQEELAERTRLSARGISDLERGVTTHPRKDTLHLLIDALQLTGEERETLTAATRAARMTPAPQVTAGNASGNDGTGDVAVTGRNPARTPQHRRGPRLSAISRQRASPRLVAITASILILVVIATGGMVGHRLAHTSSDRGILPVSGGTFHPWGRAQPSHTSSVVHFSNAFRTTVDRHGNIYVTEGSGLWVGTIPTDHVDIVKLSPSGQVLARWGHFGSHRGELNQPAGVVVDPDGNVYVADYGNDRIQKFSPAGKVLAVWGSFGTAPGHFDLPMGIALDSQGNVYVTDYGNNRIQKLSPSGRVLAVWGHACGSQPGQFCNPSDVAIGASGHVYVVDYGNYRIQTLSSTGQSLNAWTPPSNPLVFNGPFSLAIGPRDTIYVAGHDGSRGSTFTSSGTSRGRWQVGTSWTNYPLLGLTVDPTGHLLAVTCDAVRCDRLYRLSPDGVSSTPLTIASPPTPARFDRPSVLAIDRHGVVYVMTGSSENHLQEVSASGRVVRTWGGTTFNPHGLYDLTGMVVDDRNNIYVSDVLSSQILKVSPAEQRLKPLGSEGDLPGQFETPYGLTMDHHGNLYVADTGNNRIQKLSPTGRPLGEWGQFGTTPGQFNAPRAVAIGVDGAMYVGDTGNDRIQKLSPSGNSLAVWGPTLSNGSHLRDVSSVGVDSRGNVYAVDALGDRVIELSPTGTVIAQWGTKGVRPGQFRGPESVAVDRNDNVYVADTENDRIQKLSH